LIKPIRDVLAINRIWDRSRAWTRILRFVGLMLLLATPLYSFAQAHLLRQRPFRATEDQRSGGDHICDLRRDSNNDGEPDRLGDYVCVSGTVIAEPYTFDSEGEFFWIRSNCCGMLVYGSAEPVQVGDSVTVGGHLRPAGRGDLFREAGLDMVGGFGIKELGATFRGVNPNTRPMLVRLHDYCENPAKYAGNLIQISGVFWLSPPVWDGKNCFRWAGDGRDSFVLFLDGDTGIEVDHSSGRCFTITGVSMMVHVPELISACPEWCLAPRFQGDLEEHGCSTDASFTTWGSVKSAFSD
jgi:hypothetical protein